VHRASEFAQKVRGMRAKQLNQKRFKEKIEMKKNLAVHDEKDVEHGDGAVPKGAVPAYLLDREGVTSAKVLSNTVKQKRKEKAGKWAVPLPKVKPIAGLLSRTSCPIATSYEKQPFGADCRRRNVQDDHHGQEEIEGVEAHGDEGHLCWRQLHTQTTKVRLTEWLQSAGFIPSLTLCLDSASRYERFIRPAALRFKKANVTHPELATTFHLDIIGVKKNPSSALYTQVRNAYEPCVCVEDHRCVSSHPNAFPALSAARRHYQGHCHRSERV
jgi:ribosomal protein S8E